MANATLGTYTFDVMPSKMTFIQKDRETAYQKTYTNVALFSWGLSYVGKVLDLSWEFMSTAQYKSLQDIFVADVPVVFDPQDGSAKTFNVEVLNLDGEYFVAFANATGNARRNVKMSLLIMSEAS